ncbi:hypothetical protein F0562_018522 [Nyssa sinensis]|uniref:RING-type domain-containing protein n=1 Tax=Nyssa sinensis TaxID=561372 RepID=A0A5J4ZCH5_9ASTE|nr:hypothetical protein F0562_018522 [Nyssa sinensis]
MVARVIRSESAAQKLREKYRAEALEFVQLRRCSLKGNFEFVCTLCGFDYDNDEELRSHFTVGITHTIMLELADKTLLKSNPWPFDDGYIFFHGQQSDGEKIEGPTAPTHIGYKNLTRVGYGEIALSIREVDQKISKIWCEFLGNNCNRDLDASDFAIVAFRYQANLGAPHLEPKTRAQAYRVTCQICCNYIYDGKDASTLLNTHTRELACTGTNVNGAFHFFHTRCILLWILICDYHGERVSCPICRGTGVVLPEGEESVRVEELREDKYTQFKQYASNVWITSRSWFSQPEEGANPTVGLAFPRRFDESPTQQNVVRKKSITFYRVEENQLPAQ